MRLLSKREHRPNGMSIPAVLACEECALPVPLKGFTNTCECGADYNMDGHLLAPRDQWGEETGESVADILAADTDYDNERGSLE